MTDENGQRLVFKASDIQAYEAPGAGKRVIRYIVEPENTPLRNFMMGLTTLGPGETNGVVSHPAEEVFFMLEGSATVSLDGRESIVEHETVIVIPSNVSHQITNHTTQPSRFVFVTSPTKPIEAKQSWARVSGS